MHESKHTPVRWHFLQVEVLQKMGSLLVHTPGGLGGTGVGRGVGVGVGEGTGVGNGVGVGTGVGVGVGFGVAANNTIWLYKYCQDMMVYTV
jgi:hypothetical protein